MNVDDTLSDACGLLDEMGTCIKTSTENCSDFNKTKNALEGLCELKSKRDDRKYNPDDWVTLGEYQFKKFKRNDWLFILALVMIFFPMAIFYTLIHETGHWLVATAFGWEVIDFQIAWFPFVMDSFSGHVVALVPFTAEDWQVMLLFGGGSLFSLAVAYVFFFLFYKYDFHVIAEIHFVVYSIVLGMDALMYIFTDVFFGGTGDWYKLMHYFGINGSIFVGIVFILSIVNVILFTINFKKIIRKINYRI